MTLFGIFSQPPVVQLAGFSFFSALAWSGADLFLRRLNARLGARDGALPVAPSFVAVTTIFALSLGFLAADIWEQKRRAVNAAYNERLAMDRFVAIVGPTRVDSVPALAAVERYRAAVIKREWGANRNRSPDGETDDALNRVWKEVAALARTEAPPAVVAQLFKVVDDLAAARSTRLSIGVADRSNAWFMVVVLCLSSYFAIVSVHLDRPAAGRLAITIFAVATTLAFWFLAMHDSPYSGGIELGSGLLKL